MEVKLKGVWLCLRHELRQMEAQGGHALVTPRQIRTSRPFLSNRLKSFSDGPLGCLSPISH